MSVDERSPQEAAATKEREERIAGDMRAALKARSEDSFAEGASGSAAAAREQLLQLCRSRRRLLALGRWPHWDDDDRSDIEWVCRLAEAGHVGARRIRDRILDLDGRGDWAGRRVYRLGSNPVATTAAEHLAARVPAVALAFAMQEFLWQLPDPARAAGLLELAGEDFAAIGRSMRELYPDGGAAPPVERRTLWDYIEIARGRQSGQGHGPLTETIVNDRERRARAQEARRWRDGHRSAADKRAYLRDTLSAGDLVLDARDDFLLAGAACEAGVVTGRPDLDMALKWYTRVAGVTGLDAQSCARLAANFEVFAENESFALGWYERGIEQGSATCLIRWMRACANRELGCKCTAAEVLARARAFVERHGPIDWLHAPLERDFAILSHDSAMEKIVRRVHEELVARGTPAAAAWLEAAAASGSARARRMLDALLAGKEGDTPSDATLRMHRADRGA